MAVLAWKHGTERRTAKELLLSRLIASGYDRCVNWSGDSFSSVMGWGTILDVEGRIDDDYFVLEKSRGAVGNVVLNRCRAILEDLFPGGEQSQGLRRADS